MKSKKCWVLKTEDDIIGIFKTRINARKFMKEQEFPFSIDSDPFSLEESRIYSSQEIIN